MRWRCFRDNCHSVSCTGGPGGHDCNDPATDTKRIPPFSTIVTKTVFAAVDIKPDEMHRAGWHHESECSGVPVVPSTLGAAFGSLHRRAHPSQSRSVRLCHEEPRRSLTLAQLDQVDE